MRDKRETWSGRLGITLATIGSAVGIGSIWKFPYEVGANGGGAFVLFYVLGLALIVVPLMLAEFAIGRRGRGDCARSLAVVADAHGASKRWALAGVFGVLTGFIILSYYAVIGGWTIGYAVETITRGLPGASAAGVQARFDGFLAAPLQMLLFHALFMGVLALIVSRGIAGGIEATARVLMPVLMLLMLALAAYGVIEGDLGATLRFLFQIDPQRVTPRAALEAIGLGFFSIGVGLGLMITYAGYSGAGIDLKRVAIVAVLADTAISILAGLAVFPVVFAHGLDPASGPGLVFVTLPLAFAQMPFGGIAAAAFFVLLFIAALESAVSMLELVVALLMRRFGWRRPVAAWLAAGACFVLGIATVLSFNVWADWHPLATIPAFETATIFDLLDEATSNIMLPLGGLALAIFAGWALPIRALADELQLGPRASALLRAALRYIAPAGIAAAALATWLL
jgi:neurotransmitter:Na+ symporter, NSS family